MRLTACLLLSTLAFSVAQAQTYIIHASVVDVETKEIHPDYTIVINDDTIAQVGPSKKIKPVTGAQVIDAAGKWVMPGLVDAHVHFFQTGGLYTRPDAIDLRKYQPYEKEIQWYKNNMESQLRRYLSCGITTVIDDGATLGLLKQRDTFATKTYAPRILMAGPLISTAYAPKPFDIIPDPDAPFYTVNTPEQAVKMTQKEYPSRPDFIKIWYIVIDPNTAKGAQDNLSMVKATIEEAHKNHYRVAVHATERVTAQLAVQAGADFLVHEIDDEVVSDTLVRLLKDHNVVVCPTMVVESGYANTFGQHYIPSAEDISKGDPVQLSSLGDLAYLPDSTLSKRYHFMVGLMSKRNTHQDSVRSVNLKKMADAGITIATGTDAGNIGTLHASSFFNEIRAMQAAGLTNWQILVSSTLNGAKALGRENEFGSIRKGKSADILILGADPLADLGNLEKIDKILHRGAILQPDSLILVTPSDVVQRQDNAFNAHDLEGFLSLYSDTATIYEFPDKVLAHGKTEMRKMYGFLSRAPTLHVTIAGRIVMGKKVCDHEVIIFGAKKSLEGMAIYDVEDGKISKAYLINN